MANQEHLDILRQGIEAWNQWRLEHAEVRIDLVGAILVGADLRQADLRQANLRGANLEGAYLEGADLERANLERANLEGAYLRGANLEGAYLRWANLRGANLRGTNLEGADLERANLFGANLFGANLRGANLFGANLRGANLFEAILEEAMLEGAMLERADLEWAILNAKHLDDRTVSSRPLGRLKSGESASPSEAVEVNNEPDHQSQKAIIATQLPLTLSLSHIKRTAKGHSSPFIIILYPPGSRPDVDNELRTIFGTRASTERQIDTGLTPGLIVIVELSSRAIEFSQPAKIALKEKPTKVSFVGQPKDDCMPGEQTILISIRDAKEDIQYVSETAFVSVDDYAFDHVSRPKVQIGVSVISSIAALAIWLLTLLGKIDTTWGVASGTTAAAVSGFLYWQFQQLYQKIGSTTQFPRQP